MAVRESRLAVVQYVAFVVERRQADFVHFHGVQNVVGRSEHSVPGLGEGRGVLQNLRKALVTNLRIQQITHKLITRAISVAAQWRVKSSLCFCLEIIRTSCQNHLLIR